MIVVIKTIKAEYKFIHPMNWKPIENDKLARFIKVEDEKKQLENIMITSSVDQELINGDIP